MDPDGKVLVVTGASGAVAVTASRVEIEDGSRCKAEWTQDDAEAELAKALLKIEPEKPKGRASR